MNIFGSLSTRSVSTSNRKISRLSFKDIAKSAGWSNEKVFTQFYDRLIQENFSNYLFRWNLMFFMYMYIYGVIYTENIYKVFQINKNPELLIILSLILSNQHYTRELETNQERIYKLNSHLRVKVNLSSSFCPVLDYRCPSWKPFKCDSFRNNCLNTLKKVCQTSFKYLTRRWKIKNFTLSY